MAARFLPMVESSKLPIRYPEFAARVRKAMAQGNWEVQGIVDGFKRAGIRITYEMVRRYSLGQAMPRQDKMGSLAQILGVSPSYLQYGLEGDVSKGQKPAPPPRAASAFYPFLRIRPEDYAALDDDAKDDIEGIIELRIRKAARSRGRQRGTSSATGTEDA